MLNECDNFEHRSRQGRLFKLIARSPTIFFSSAATTMTSINKYDFLTHDELFNAVENDLSDNNFKTSATFLLSAINDWPTSNLQESAELISELKFEIKDKLIFDNLNNYRKYLKPGKDSWKMEAISSLIEMFDLERTKQFDRTIDLETIIENISGHYRAKSDK